MREVELFHYVVPFRGVALSWLSPIAAPMLEKGKLS